MYRLKQGHPGQLPELIAFAERAFATVGSKPDFARLLPKLYGPDKATESQHILLYEDEILEGLCAVQVQDFTVAGQLLRVGWVGTVAVAPEARGKGHLERLIIQAGRKMEQAECDLAVLGGQRQRYRRFGYEYGGSQWEFTLDRRSLCGAKPGLVQLCSMEQDNSHIARAYQMWSKGPIQAPRTLQSFGEVLHSWDAQPNAVLYEGRFAGYCTLEILPEQVILRELCLSEEVPLPAFGAAVLEAAKRETFTAVLPPWPGRTQRWMATEASSARLAENHSFRVLNWSRVLEVLLTLRAQVETIPVPGSFCFAVEDGPPLCLQADGQSSLRCVPAMPEQEPMRMSEEQAVRLLLGPMSALEPGYMAVPAGWLPLPMAFSWQDGI